MEVGGQQRGVGSRLSGGIVWRERSPRQGDLFQPPAAPAGVRYMYMYMYIIHDMMYCTCTCTCSRRSGDYDITTPICVGVATSVTNKNIIHVYPWIQPS